MTAVSQIVPNLLGGVSQQADPIKLPGQVRNATNVLLDPTFGCKKRPATKFIKELANDLPKEVKWFNIFRDGNEKYVVAIFNGFKGELIQTENITAAQEVEYTVLANKLKGEERINVRVTTSGGVVTDVADANVEVTSDENEYTVKISNTVVNDGDTVTIFQIITEPDIRIWDALTGERRVVDFTSKSRFYLNAENIESLKPLTINDYTLLCNTERRVQMIDQKNTLENIPPQVLVILNTVSKDTEYGIDFINPNSVEVATSVTTVTKLNLSEKEKVVDEGDNEDGVCRENDTQTFIVGQSDLKVKESFTSGDLKFQLRTTCSIDDYPVPVEGEKKPTEFSDATTARRDAAGDNPGWFGRQGYFTKNMGQSDRLPNGQTEQTFQSENDPSKTVRLRLFGVQEVDYSIYGQKVHSHQTGNHGDNEQFNINFEFDKSKDDLYLTYDGTDIRRDQWEYVSDAEAAKIWKDNDEEGQFFGRIRVKWTISETKELRIVRPARPYYKWKMQSIQLVSVPEGNWSPGEVVVSKQNFDRDYKRHSDSDDDGTYKTGEETRIYVRIDAVREQAESDKYHYISQYSTEVTLLDGGEGFAEGNKFSVVMKGRTYNLSVASTSTSKQEEFAGSVTLKLKENGEIDSNVAGHSPGNQASVTGILKGLKKEIEANTSELGNFEAQVIGNVLFVKNTNNDEFNVRTRSGLGTHSLMSIKNSVNDPSLLPTQCKEDFVLKVSNSADSESDDYFLRFVPSLENTDGQGVWEETTAPGIDLELDPETMPHALIRRADGSFIFQSLGEPDYSKEHTVAADKTEYTWKFPYVRESDVRMTVKDSNGDNEEDFTDFVITINKDGDNTVTLTEPVDTGKIITIYRDYSTDPLYWAPRAVGDDISNPIPSFIGQKINNLFFFSNRLGILSQDTVVMSQPSDYFNFFVGSAIATADSDPIDITASATKPATLKSALSTAKGLLLFAENSQYLVTSDDNVFGPATIKINEISNYGYQSQVDPVETGVSIMFSTESTTFTKVFELALDSIDNRPVVSENTRIVPEYVPPNLKFVESSSNNSIVLFGDGSEEIFVFKFYNATSERNQAGWCKWVMPAPVRNLSFDQDSAFIVMHHGNSCTLAQLDMLDDPRVSPISSLGRSFTPRLDLYQYKSTLPENSIVESTESSEFGMSRISLPAGSHVDKHKITLAVTEAVADTEFYEFDVDTDNFGQKSILVPTEIASAQFVMGMPYDMVIEFPSFFVLNDKKADRKNHPVVHTAYFDFYYSGRTEATLKRVGYDDQEIGLEAIRADLYRADTTTMDEITTNAMSIYCRGDLAHVTIKAHDPLPVSITSYRWEGSYNNRGVSII